MFNMLNIIFEIQTNGPMQNLVNEISEEYYNNIEYMQCHDSEKILYIVFRDTVKINELNKLSTISTVNTDITLFGQIIKKLIGYNKLRTLNPKVSKNNYD